MESIEYKHLLKIINIKLRFIQKYGQNKRSFFMDKKKLRYFFFKIKKKNS